MICAYCGGRTDVAAITHIGHIPVCIDCLSPELRQDLARALDGMDAGDDEYIPAVPEVYLPAPNEET
jgi:hypothetical protein